ncbi:MAG: hypothetical protein LBM78_02555, partial [Clostridiales bacterium]|nr:hypothetical protein [Clostridiales bacterium]
MQRQTTQARFSRALVALVVCLGIVAVYLVGLAPVFSRPTAKAAEEFEDGLPQTTAFLTWGSSGAAGWLDDTSASARNTTVRGAGTYVVAHDFSAVANNSRPYSGSFLAIQVKDAPELYPGWAIRLISIKVTNSAATPVTTTLELACKGYTNDEDGNTRMNLYNQYSQPPLPASARSWDGNMETGLTETPWNVVQNTALGANGTGADRTPRVSKIEVTFSWMQVGAPIDIAYLGGDAIGGQPQSWAEVPTGSQGVRAEIVGNGYYTVGVIGTSNIANPNIAIVVAGGADDYPGSVIRIVSVKAAMYVAGALGEYEDIPFKRGNTRDEGTHNNRNSIRTNIYNSYAPEMGINDRTWDENTSEMTNWVLDSGKLQGYRAVLIEFQFIPIEAGEVVEAYIEYADTAWDAVYFTDMPESTAAVTPAQMKNVGNYTTKIDFTNTKSKKAIGVDEFRLRVVDGETHYEGWFLRVNSITLNGNELILPEDEQVGGLLPGITYPDGGDMLMDIFTKSTFGKIPGQRSDAGIEIFKASHNRIQDDSVFAEVTTIEIAFRFVMAKLPEELPIDALEHLKNTDHSFYLGVQAEAQYTFRNAWSEKNYGIYGTDSTFDKLYRTDGATHDCGGTFTDVLATSLVTAKDGGADYVVKLNLAEGDYGFTGENNLSLLFVSTTIFYDLYYQGNVSFYGFTVVIDGQPHAVGANEYRVLSATDDRIGEDLDKEPLANPAAYAYAQIQYVNTWSKFSPFEYALPTER